MNRGVLRPDDLMTEDDLVLAKLDAADIPLIARKLESIRHFRPESVNGYAPRVVPKARWLDPPVLTGHRSNNSHSSRRAGPESGHRDGPGDPMLRLSGFPGSDADGVRARAASGGRSVVPTGARPIPASAMW